MSYPTVINGLDFRDLIFVADNDPVTDSFMVAKAFGKRPDNVIRDIEKLLRHARKSSIQNSILRFAIKTMSCRTESRRSSIDSAKMD